MISVQDLDTPAVIVHLDRLEANIARIQSIVSRQGLGNRPHVKTHKIPAIARMQMAAGAVGLTVQKLGEAEIFIDARVCDDFLLTFNILGERKTDRLMELAGRVKRLAVVADNDTVVRGLSEAGLRHGRDVHLLIECDTGFGRNGVQSPEAALELAHYALKLPRIVLDGLMVFPNTAPKTRAFFDRAIELFAVAGIPIPVLSGGGTPALAQLADFPMMTEHRAGTYVYNDVMMVHSGIARWEDCAMHVRATVVSRPTTDRAVVDSGSKVLSSDQYYVEHYGRLVEYPDAFVSALSEEHAIVDLSRSATRPKVGDVISIVPNHCCSVSNINDEVHGVRNGRVEVVWPVAARGKVR
jgi:D-serine deaminase-like pyridoxal phosphate-dependent protein